MTRYNCDIEYLNCDVDISKDELNNIIVEADKIISDINGEKEKCIEAYLKKVQCLQKLDKYTESKESIDKLLSLNPNMPEALARLGNFYSVKGEYCSAIKFVTKAIKLKKEYAYAYYIRGNIYRNKDKCDKALHDYSAAIRYNHNYMASYNNRGLTRYGSHDYQGAIEDYSKAIDIEPKNARAYYNRGIAKYCLSHYLDAIKDYDNAIENNSQYTDAYYNRCFAYIKLEQYKNAADDLKNSGASLLDVLIAEGEEKTKRMLDYNDFFKKATEENKMSSNVDDYKDIYIKSLRIISKLHINDSDELNMLVSHYTKKNIAEKLLFDNNLSPKTVRDFFRLYSVNTSNDPEEGKTLFHYLFPKEIYSSMVEEFGAFAGCFILNSDSLNQFRLYGKTEDKEDATSVSISLNENFFNKNIHISVEMKSDQENRCVVNQPNSLPLFRCIYIDPETNKIISLGQREEYVFYREHKKKKDYKKYKSEIDKIQKKISNELKVLKRLVNNKELNKDILYKLLLNLRYLIKHVAFKEEQECRIIRIIELNDSKNIKLDDNNHRFVEYLKLNEKNVSRICFAPNAKDINKFKQHLAHNNYHIECDRSKAPLA